MTASAAQVGGAPCPTLAREIAAVADEAYKDWRASAFSIYVHEMNALNILPDDDSAETR